MALSFLYPHPKMIRPECDEKGHLSYFNGSFIVYTVSNDGNQFVMGQIYRPAADNTGKGRKAAATPPMHIHLHQTEKFLVKEGTLTYSINGKQGALKAGEEISTPVAQPHTFWNASEIEPLHVHVTIEGGGLNRGFDERFARNFYGYLNSVAAQGRKPSVLQLLVFLYHADVVLADVPFGKAFNYIGYLVGEKLLGMKPSYKEFEDA
ncbi:hypothetical protein OIO90_001109 [Microbotryomycetes sp. JL221]|nr:hypothetical protein OIO90_001109 [Microbotryomycetes sp. JL221]